MDTTTSEAIWLTRQEVADRLRVPFPTMNNWAAKGYGPRYIKVGRHSRYRLDDVIAWENAQFDGPDAA